MALIMNNFSRWPAGRFCRVARQLLPGVGPILPRGLTGSNCAIILLPSWVGWLDPIDVSVGPRGSFTNEACLSHNMWG